MGAWHSSASAGSARRARRARLAAASIAVAVSSALVLSLPSGPAAQAAAAHTYKGKVWRPGPVVKQPAVPAKGGVAAKHSAPQNLPGFTAPVAQWPAAARATADLKTSGAATAAPASADAGAGVALVSLAGMPVSVGVPSAADGAATMRHATDSAGTVASAAAPTKVSVTVADHAAAQQAGVSGMVLTVARADGGTSAGPATVAVDYSGFSDAFGGDFADRLTLVSLPACSLTTPAVAACRKQTQLQFTNDRKAHKLIATVKVPGTRPAAATSATGQDSALVIAASSTPTGMNGTYTASSLKPSDTWSAGGNTGSFTYSYPITTPPSLGGTEPGVGLSYNSADVDGRTSASNAQGSWVGDGWDYDPGFVERSYKPCSKAGYPTSSDQCWGTTNVTISLPGHSGEIVHDDSSDGWRLAGDDGTKVDLLNGASNGNAGDDGTYWKLTTTDGTQYFFGANRLPGGQNSATEPVTYSAWGMPVFGAGAADGGKCADPASSDPANCRTGWRWNLDFVIDPHDNLTRYTYAREENFYLRGANNSPTEYQAGGFLTEIDYGWRTEDYYNAAVHPAATVVFNPANRCISQVGQAGYDTRCPAGPVQVTNGMAVIGLSAANYPAFVDTPFDQHCFASGTQDNTSTGAKCLDYTPVFFNTERLASITTNVWNGSAYRPVDVYSLPQQFNAVPDPSTAGNRPTLWLAGINHTGYVVNQDGTTVATADPPIYTYGQFLPNRAATHTFNAANNASDYNRLRLNAITNTVGSEVDVSYSDVSTLCPGSTAPTITANSTLCYPEYWTIPGNSSPTLDWFNKYVVTTVSNYDDTSLSPSRAVNYTYLGTPVWHTNDSEQVEAAYRTFDQFRGYSRVQTVTGTEADGSNTKSVVTYFRGMDQDGNASYSFEDANKHVWVTDGHGDAFNPGDPGLRDDNALAGQALETQTFASATSNTVLTDAVNVPVDPTSTGPDPGSMVTAQHIRVSPLPVQRAHFNHLAKTVTYQQVSTGTRRSEVDYSYDNTVPTSSNPGGNGRLLMTDDKGDGTVQELCKATRYAARPNDTQRTSYPSEASVALGPCNYNAGFNTGNLISDTITLYDGSTTVGVLPGPGDPTTVQTAKNINTSGVESWATTSQTYDGTYGRIASATDADQHVTRTSYNPPSGALPTSYTVTNPKNWKATTGLDQGRGIPETSSDVNGHVTTEMFDGMGRVTGVWKPDRPWAANKTSPDIEYVYQLYGSVPHPTGPQPNAYVDTRTLDEDGGYADSYSELDGFGDAVQTQSPALDQAQGRMIVNTRYDTLGRVIETNLPYFDQGATTPTGSWASWTDNLPSQTVTTYDGMSRPLTVTQKHNGVTVPGSVATTAYPGADRTDVTGPSGNGAGPVSATSTFTDVRGRTTALWTYHNSPVSPTGNAADADVTTYGFTYDPNGNEGTLTTVTDATTKNTWTTSVTDLLGHSVTKSDPDAGISASYTDDAGLLLDTVDGRGRVLAYTYDALNRKTGEFDGGTITDRTTLPSVWAGDVANAANQLAGWTFDPAGNNGQPDASIRYVGGNPGSQYTQQVTGYDADYRPLSTKVIIPQSEGALAGTYQTNNYYSALTGRVDRYDTPAVPKAGLGAETIYNSYNRYNLLLSTGGNADYLVDTQYDHDGKILSRTVGDYPYQVVQQNLYDAATNRVTNVFTDATAGMSTIDNSQVNSYTVDGVSNTYDAAGRLTSTADLQNWSVSGSYNPGNAQRDLQCYTYDYAGRLTNAWSDAGDQTPPATTNPGGPTTATGGIGSCASSTTNNPPTASSAATQIGGPAPYWQSYTFDATGATGLGNGAQTGNRSTIVDHDVTGNTTKDVTHTSSFPGAGTANTAGSNITGGSGPHLLSQVTASGGVTGTDNYSYDGSGDTTVRNLAAGPNETLAWNAEGQLDTVTDTSGGTTKTAKYLYDANGGQLIRRDTGGTNAGVTLYLGATEVHLTGTATVTGNRYYDYPSAPGIVGSSTGAITYQVNNDQGTSGTTIDAATGHVTARRYVKPYGDARGAGTAATFGAFPDDHTFLGMTTDATTGLVDVGARKYDPGTGRFISVDPEFQPGAPQTFSGYSYAGNDPVSASDPTGLRATDDDGNAAPPPKMGPLPDSLVSISPHVSVWSGDPRFSTYLRIWDAGQAKMAGKRPDLKTADQREAATWVSGCQSQAAGIACIGAFGGAVTSFDVAENAGASAVGGIDVLYDASYQMEDVLQKNLLTNGYNNWTQAAAGMAAADAGMAMGRALAAKEMVGELDVAPKGLSGDASAEIDDTMTGELTGCNSFSRETPVLMADGSDKPIADVKVGDVVEGTDTTTWSKGPHKVTALIRHSGPHRMVAVTLANDATINATDNHPFWDATTQRFTNAIDLKTGDLLRTPDGQTIPVRALKVTSQDLTAYNLTIDGVHTYYVVAGDTPVLVHNSDGCAPDLGSSWKADSEDSIAGSENCEECALQIQEKLGGGDILQIEPAFPGPYTKLPYQGVDSGWKAHYAVIKDGQVFDNWTGRNGVPEAEYLDRFYDEEGKFPVVTMEGSLQLNSEGTGTYTFTPNYR